MLAPNLSPHDSLRVLLISTYELGRQPFGLASPAAWLARAGARVAMSDLSVEPLDEAEVRAADLIAFHLPMHTATRLAARVIPRVRRLNPRAHLACYGLYAPMNAEFLRGLGVATILGGEFEEGLAALAQRVAGGGAASRDATPMISLARQRFLTPERGGLPPLDRYARLRLADGSLRIVGATEASRGCKHRCRHCPVVPVYDGRFRIVDSDVVLEDVRRQVAAGAQHITFGDPDFWNAPGHALPLVRALHAEFPDLTYDVTIKVEHLLAHARHLDALRETGCAFVTTAVESLDDRVLALLDKGHTADDFRRVVALFRDAGLVLAPTFVTFTPWTTLDGYLALLDEIAALGLVENVAPVQLAIRLLVPAGSLLLDVPEMGEFLGEFDSEALSWRWTHPDARIDALSGTVRALVRDGEQRGVPRATLFAEVRFVAEHIAERAAPRGFAEPRAPVPHLTEPWFC